MNLTPSIVLSVEVLLAVAAIVLMAVTGTVIKRENIWKGEHFYSGAFQIGWASVMGIALSYCFGTGISPFYTVISCLAFMTFWYPFLAFAWISDWPGGRFQIRDHGRAALSGLGAFLSSMFVLGVAVSASCMNAGLPASFALVLGTCTFAVAAFLLLALAARSDGWFVRAS